VSVLEVLDNLAGHLTLAFVLGLFEHGIIPLYTPLGASWLNMTESIQHILERRALAGQHPQSPTEIIEWLEAATHG
jgi:transposase